jgi:hypothetical protein
MYKSSNADDTTHTALLVRGIDIQFNITDKLAPLMPKKVTIKEEVRKVL